MPYKTVVDKTWEPRTLTCHLPIFAHFNPDQLGKENKNHAPRLEI